MTLRRYEMTDFEWSVIAPLLPNKPRGFRFGWASPGETFVIHHTGWTRRPADMAKTLSQDLRSRLIGAVEGRLVASRRGGALRGWCHDRDTLGS